MNSVKTIFGMRTKAQKNAERAAADAQAKQTRMAEEEAALAAASRASSGVRLRAGGRRATAFMGNDNGLSPTLGG